MTPPHESSARLRTLAEKLESCPCCDLAKTRNFVFPGEGPENAKVMFIGIAPSPSSDSLSSPELNHPFFEGARRPFGLSTTSGKILKDWLDFVGLSRESVYLTNIVKCSVKDRAALTFYPTEDQIRACSFWIIWEIQIIRPRLIVPLGEPAAGLLLGGQRFDFGQSIVVRKYYGGEILQIKFFPLWHPMAMQGYTLNVHEIPENAKLLLERLRNEIKQDPQLGELLINP